MKSIDRRPLSIATPETQRAARLAATVLLGATGATLALFAVGTVDPLVWLAFAGLGGGVVGRGWRGLGALLGGAAVASVLLLAAWPTFDPAHAHDVPLVAVIMTAAVPILMGGGYLLARSLVALASRLTVR